MSFLINKLRNKVEKTDEKEALLKIRKHKKIFKINEKLKLIYAELIFKVINEYDIRNVATLSYTCGRIEPNNDKLANELGFVIHDILDSPKMEKIRTRLLYMMIVTLLQDRMFYDAEPFINEYFELNSDAQNALFFKAYISKYCRNDNADLLIDKYLETNYEFGILMKIDYLIENAQYEEALKLSFDSSKNLPTSTFWIEAAYKCLCGYETKEKALYFLEQYSTSLNRDLRIYVFHEMIYYYKDSYTEKSIDIIKNYINNYPKDSVGYFSYSNFLEDLNIDESICMMKKANDLSDNNNYVSNMLSLYRKSNNIDYYNEYFNCFDILSGNSYLNYHYANDLLYSNFIMFEKGRLKKLFSDLTKQDNKPICIYSRLGLIYEFGIGVKKSTKKACKYYSKASRINCTCGSLFYSRMAYLGKEIKQNREFAKEIILKTKNDMFNLYSRNHAQRTALEAMYSFDGDSRFDREKIISKLIQYKNFLDCSYMLTKYFPNNNEYADLFNENYAKSTPFEKIEFNKYYAT